MLRALIVDDEPLAREALRKGLQHDPDVRVIGEAGNGRQALALLAKEKPDLLFLDIRMPEMGAFELLNELSHDRDVVPLVIFVTSHDEYAIDAFERRAVDYLLKPFDQGRLRRAVETAKLHLETAERREALRAIRHVLEDLERRRQSPRMAIKTEGRVLFLNPSEIRWVEAQGNYVLLHTASGSHVLRAPLHVVEEKLKDYNFVRLHRSVLANVEYVREVKPWPTGEYVLTLDDGREITVTRTYKQNLAKIAGLAIGTELFDAK
ncbi:MAG: LytTR family DNA-binding domain-containing protein [Acidobacteriales bacterium]|nr:LytTR family DNA-binding domain-containing protein [Terriglobales bacterium]